MTTDVFEDTTTYISPEKAIETFPIRYYFLDEDNTVLDTMELTIDPEGEFSPAEMAIKYRDETWPGKEIAVTVSEYVQ